MFGWFRRRAEVSPIDAVVAEGRAIYAIGDIHGRLDLLQRLLGQIAADAQRHPADRERAIVVLGDYVDRGPASRGVIEALQEPPPGFACVFLLGNHEEAMLDFLDGHSDGMKWLSYGGIETVLSYGVSLRGLSGDEETTSKLREEFRAAVPSRHVDFLRRCVLSHDEGDYLFVHAGVRPGVALERQRAEDLLWIRDDFLRSPNPMPGKVVVHGHTICDVPQDLGYRIDIDTGAFVSGRLTALALRGRQRHFLATEDLPAPRADR
jgi:serine/threonine protein phosphatase 1